MIKPLFNATDDQWVTMVGRYILNMGAVEAATRLLIINIIGTDSAPIFSDDLAARIGFIRKRFPRENAARHQWAMKAFKVADKHTGFRNIVAQLISLEELTGRVDESAILGRQLLELQGDFKR